jgi:hypothetical protein
MAHEASTWNGIKPFILDVKMEPGRELDRFPGYDVKRS